MIKKEVYFIEVAPFRILEKKHYKTLMISSKGNYKSVDSAPLSNFKKGDYLLRSILIGCGSVRINYFKTDEKEIKENFQKNRLENLFTQFKGSLVFPNN
jgi:hypothetical protein